MIAMLADFGKKCSQCGFAESIPLFWLILGFSGQAVFAARFIVQWLVSEKLKMSVIPIGFWYLSISGSLVSLVYALRQRDPVFILAYLFNSVVYVRNLILLARRGESLSPFALPKAASSKGPEAPSKGPEAPSRGPEAHGKSSG
jgi:lipid-A-disaccharide synthase-like uncharacterized protein